MFPAVLILLDLGAAVVYGLATGNAVISEHLPPTVQRAPAEAVALLWSALGWVTRHPAIPHARS